MKPEIEVKFLNANHNELRAKLEELGAECVQPMRLMRRKNFDFADLRLLNDRNGWVRVRDEGDKVTMSYKQVDDRTPHGTKEVNLAIDSFDNADAFLDRLGLVPKAYQETKRESWKLADFEIELDEWPWVRPYLEIEGPDEATLRDIAIQLGLDWTEACHGSVEIDYQAEYDVTDQEINHIDTVVFGPAPEWLEARRLLPQLT